MSTSPNVPYTLVVIDMQEYFSASRKSDTQKKVATAIRRAMRDNAGVMFVEYANYGPTLPKLTKLTKTYKRAFTVIKSANGGGNEVKTALYKHRLPRSNLKFCGVNTDYCVLATVTGVSQNLPRTKIEVLEKGCNSNGSHARGIERLQALNKVSINYK